MPIADKLYILLVEDSEDDALLVKDKIASAGYEAILERVQTREGFLNALAHEPWDIIISDHNLPTFDSLSALNILKQVNLDIPFIIVSGEMSEEEAARAMQSGANDFFTKQHLQRLVPAIEREIQEYRERYRNYTVEIERERASRALADSQTRLKAIFEYSEDGMIIIDNEMRCVDVNPAACNILEASSYELVGLNLRSKFIPSPENGQMEDHRQNFLKAGKSTGDYVLRSANGTERIIEYRAVANITHGLHLVVINDVTERKRQEQEVRRAKTLLETTFAGMNEVVLVTEQRNRTILMCNPATEKTLGYTSEELVGQTILKLLMNEAAYHHLRELANPTLDEGQLFRIEYPLRCKDGTIIITEMTLTPIFVLGDGSERGAVIVIRDITARKEMENNEREQRILTEALSDTIATLTSTLELQEVMQRILENVGRVVPHESANIMLIEGNSARIEFMQGYPEHIVEAFKNYRYSLELPNLHAMLATGRPYLIADSTTDPAWIKIPNAEYIRSYIGAPIRRQGQVIGFINLDSTIPGFYAPAHLARLQAFADQAAIAIENAQVYNTLSEYANEMAALNRATSHLFAPFSTSQGLEELGKQVVDAVVKAFNKVDCGIMLADWEHNELMRLARAGDYQVQANQPLFLDGLGLAPEAARRGEMVYAPDTLRDPRYVLGEPRTRSEIVVPIRTAQKVIGVLDLQSSQLNAFGPNDQRILKAFAERAATALENALLYKEVQSYANELELRVSERTAQLEQAREHVETILNSSSNGIILAHTDGVIRQTNPAFDDMFRYEADEAFGKALTELVIPTQVDAIESVLRLVASRKETTRLEVTAVRKDGIKFDAELALSVIQTHKAGTTGIVCTFHDITSHKQIQDYLQASLARERELSELKSRFVSMVSHEFRTPLATIQVTIDSLANYFDKFDAPQRAKRFEKIRGQIVHMTDLLEDALTLSRGESGKLQLIPESIDLEKFCKTVIEEVQMTMNQPNHIELTALVEDPQFRADPKLLRQLLTNLLTNAIKYSPNGMPIQVELMCKNQELVLAVRDHGIGIPEKDQKRLFEAFHRARNVGTISGTGLGLTITKHVVNLHGGSISFASEEGHGTTFKVIIPSVKEKTQ